MNGFKCFLLALLISSCTVHVPFQSEESKAEYHIRQAYHHNPALADSIERTIYIPRKSAKWSITVPKVDTRLFSKPIVLVDTVTGVSATLSQPNDSIIYLEAECPPERVVYKEAPTVKVDSIPYWVWIVIGVLFSLNLLFISLWLDERRTRKIYEAKFK